MQFEDVPSIAALLQRVVDAANDVWDQLAQHAAQGLPAEQAKLEAQLAAAHSEFITALASWNEWAAALGGQGLEANQLWNRQVAETAAMLAVMQQLAEMEALRTTVTSRLPQTAMQASPGSLRHPLCRMLLRAAHAAYHTLFGWLPLLLSCSGFPAYTAHTQLAQSIASCEAWAIAVAIARQLTLKSQPTWAETAVAIVTAVLVALLAVAAAVVHMLKDDLPRRQQDLKELKADKAAAARIAEDGGEFASLAGAMANGLKNTERRARDELNAIRRQQARLRRLRARFSLQGSGPRAAPQQQAEPAPAVQPQAGDELV